MSEVGKQVGDDLYVHVSAIERIAADEYRLRLAAALAGLPMDVRGRVNVAKINVRSRRELNQLRGRLEDALRDAAKKLLERMEKRQPHQPDKAAP